MTQYKVVQVSNASIEHDSNPQEAAITQFQNAIDDEASKGWELVCSHTITVVQKPEPVGCLMSLLLGLMVVMKWREAPEPKIYKVEMLIFAKRT
jgi:hypothetical protein